MVIYAPGDIISEHVPFVYVLFEESKNKHCDYCVATNVSLKKCSGCNKMYYCNRNCQRADWKIHKHECRFYQNSVNIQRSNSARLLLRLNLLLKHYPEKRHQQFDVPNSPKKRSFADLIGHNDKIKKDVEAMEMFVVIVHIFKRIPDLEFDVEELFDQFCKYRINGMTIYYQEDTGLQSIGFQLSVAESAFDHSCYANSVREYIGNVCRFRAIKNIADDEPITMSYISLYEDRNTRRRQLMEKYFFLCECPRCVAGLDDDIDYAELKENSHEMMFRNNGKDFLQTLGRIYGEYHPEITGAMFKMAMLFAVSDKREEARRLAKRAKKALEITHGVDHLIYLQFIDFITCFDL